MSFFKVCKVSSTINHALDYSSAAVYAKMTNTTNRNITLHQMIIYYSDAANWSSSQEFGNLGTALTNGIRLVSIDGDDVETGNFTGDLPIKTNALWAAHTADFLFIDFGPGIDSMSIIFDFKQMGHDVLIPPGHSIAAQLHDDLSGLNELYFNCHGAAEGF